jgi:hypothetical protein
MWPFVKLSLRTEFLNKEKKVGMTHNSAVVDLEAGQSSACDKQPHFARREAEQFRYIGKSIEQCRGAIRVLLHGKSPNGKQKGCLRNTRRQQALLRPIQ